MVDPGPALPRRLGRRSVLAGLVGAAGATALAGCGNGSGGSGKSGSATLNVWGGVPAESGPDDLIAAFHKAHPDITVKYTRYVNDDEGNLKLDNSLQGGVPIDLFFSYNIGNLSKRVNAGLTLDLTDKVKDESAFSKFGVDADPQGNYVFDKKIYSVPAALSPELVLVNADALDKAGVEVPDNWDVDDYHRVAKALSKSNVYGSLGSPNLARTKLGPNYRYTPDGKASNFGNPAFREQLELALAMQKDGSAIPQKTVLSQKLQTFSQASFLSGRHRMMITQAYMLRYVSDTKEYPHDFKVRCLPVPAPVKGQEYWNEGAYGDLLSISQKSEQQDAAWEFLKFWVNEAGTYMVKGGRLPSLLDNSQADKMLDALLGSDKQKLYDVDSFKPVLFDEKMKIPVDTIYTAADEIDTIVEKLDDQVLLGDITVDQWVSQATSQANSAIKKSA